jgi:hypothetical protein
VYITMPAIVLRNAAQASVAFSLAVVTPGIRPYARCQLSRGKSPSVRPLRFRAAKCGVSGFAPAKCEASDFAQSAKCGASDFAPVISHLRDAKRTFRISHFACAKSDISHFAARNRTLRISHVRNRTLRISRRETGHSGMTKYQTEHGARHSPRVSGAGSVQDPFPYVYNIFRR